MNQTRLDNQFQFVLEHQPKATQEADHWMKRVEAAVLGVMIALFLVALYGSVSWARSNPVMIPMAWFAWAASASLVIAVGGLHSVLTGVFPPPSVLAKGQRFATRRDAMILGWLTVVAAILVCAFWGVFAYATLSLNTALLEVCVRLLATVVSVGVVIAFIAAILRMVFKSR